MKLGYARVSTADRTLDPRLAALEEAGCPRIFQDRSESRGDRPELRRLLDRLRPGDTVVVWKLDRQARSTRDSWEIAETIRAAGSRGRKPGIVPA